MDKRNYWLKLKEEFYKQPYIKKLRKIAGGDTYVIVYQEILLLSIKTNGYLFFQHIEETLEEELALILDEELINIKATLSFMRSQNLIEKIENDKYLLPDMLSLTGSESESAERVRKYRESKKLLALQCNVDVTKCNENVTTDIDIDKDKDKDKELNIYNVINTKEHVLDIHTLSSKKPLDAQSPLPKYSDINKQDINTIHDETVLADKGTVKKQDKAKHNITIYDEIINYLNQICGSKYKSTTPTTKSNIQSRLKEGFNLDDFKKVIDIKAEEWLNDPKMCVYLRPTTLFGTKFEGYLNQKPSNRNISQRTLKNFIVNQEVKKMIDEEVL